MLASGLPEEGAMNAFATKQDAEDRLSIFVWPEGRYCPKCASLKSWYIEDRDVFECTDCSWQFSLKSVSVLRRSRVPLHTSLWAAEKLILSCALKHPRSRQTIENFRGIVGCSYQAARNLRISMFNELKTVRGGFWGELVCVNEMDESHYDEDRLQELFDRYGFFDE